MRVWGYNRWGWCWRWFYKRRANRLGLLIRMLGYDFAIEYGRRRNWILKHDGTSIWLRGPGAK